MRKQMFGGIPSGREGKAESPQEEYLLTHYTLKGRFYIVNRVNSHVYFNKVKVIYSRMTSTPTQTRRVYQTGG